MSLLCSGVDGSDLRPCENVQPLNIQAVKYVFLVTELSEDFLGLFVELRLSEGRPYRYEKSDAAENRTGGDVPAILQQAETAETGNQTAADAVGDQPGGTAQIQQLSRNLTQPKRQQDGADQNNNADDADRVPAAPVDDQCGEDKGYASDGSDE